MYFIDTHTHFSMLEASPLEIIQAARSQNIRQFINIGTCAEDFPKVLQTAQEFYPQVFCTLGVHPHEAQNFSQAQDFLKAHLHHREVIAIGEIGLDYYYKHSPVEIQKEVFKYQIELALENDLPLEIHTREAEEDTIEILKLFQGEVKGLIHCFTGTQYLADEALKLGLNISLSGVVTFKGASELRQVVQSIPLDRLHIETDSPFLAPTPYRGKKNQPAYMIETIKKVAEIKEVSLEEIGKQVQKNTASLFSKYQPLEDLK